jgi:probable F420-dependent oxidoreductase
MDHTFNIGFIRERLDDKPYYHPLAFLSYLAATTQRVLLGTSVLVLPSHHPVDLAKYSATLDQVSGGRVILGVGAGSMPEEFQALGVPMRQRGSLTDESIAIMKELWTNPYPSYQSRRWSFSDLRFSPKPLQKPHIPLWIGGSSPAALRRTAASGDGWHPNGLSPEEFSLGKKEIEELASKAGRDPESIIMSTRIEVEVRPGDPSGYGEDRSRLSGNDPDRIIAAVEAYQAAGVDHIVFALNSDDVPAITRIMESISQDVIPKLA